MCSEPFRRRRHDVGLDDFERASRKVPVIANIRPSGDKYLMEDFYYAGGLPAMLEQIRPHLQTEALTVNGRSLGDNIAGAAVYQPDVIRSVTNPIYAEGALAVLRGNIAPDGVVIKPSACAPHLLRHTGRALVFDDYPSLKQAVDDPDLDVSGDDILVLRNAGPKGAGMPEWGMLPIPTKLLKAGVKDMLRLSDARMSGTSYGGCLLHCAPEAAVGAFGNIATYYQNQLLLQQTPPPLSSLAQPDIEGARLVIESVLAERRKVLTEMESKTLLSAFHIPVTQTILAQARPREVLGILRGLAGRVVRDPAH